MTQCKHYNTQGHYRCALEIETPCNECADFEGLLIFEHNALCCGTCTDPDTIIGSENDANTAANRVKSNDPIADALFAGGLLNAYGTPTVDAVIPDGDALPATSAGKMAGKSDKVEGYTTNYDNPAPNPDMVNSPAHYARHYPVEVIEMIDTLLGYVDERTFGEQTPGQLHKLGCELKYRLRAGLKGDAAEDIAKAMQYAEFRREG